MSRLKKKAGRRPASAKAVGRDKIWTTIRKADIVFTISGLAVASGADRKTVSDYLRCLVPGGIVQAVENGGFTLIRDVGIHAPRLNREGKPVTQGAGTENMWRSMRMLAQFSAQDIAVHSTTDTVSVSEATAKSYALMLLHCGYLRVVAQAVPGKRAATYRLIRNSGPKPPQIQRVKRVFDPNTGKVHEQGDRP
jgi:hypothetical protein